MQHHKKMQSSHIKQAIWDLQYTAMHYTYLNPRPVAEPKCSWQAQRTSRSTMEWYSYFAVNKSSDVIGRRSQTLCIVHQCQNGSLHVRHAKGNGISANSHPHPNRQLDCPHTTHQQILPKALKAMDMQFHWLCCRKAQDQYQFYWIPRTQNLVDYWTKHHPAIHHKAFWPQILMLPTNNHEHSKMNTMKNATTKSFVKKILSTPSFVKQLAAKQRTIAAKGA
jgi:hypothetical protein